MYDFRPITLRHQVSLILRFGTLADPDQHYVGFRRSRCVPPSFDGFAIFGSLAVLVQFNFRSMTLRRRVFPVLLFFGSNYIIARFKSNFKLLNV